MNKYRMNEIWKRKKVCKIFRRNLDMLSVGEMPLKGYTFRGSKKECRKWFWESVEGRVVWAGVDKGRRKTL